MVRFGFGLDASDVSFWYCGFVFAPLLNFILSRAMRAPQPKMLLMRWLMERRTRPTSDWWRLPVPFCLRLVVFLDWLLPALVRRGIGDSVSQVLERIKRREQDLAPLEAPSYRTYIDERPREGDLVELVGFELLRGDRVFFDERVLRAMIQLLKKRVNLPTRWYFFVQPRAAR